MIEKLHWYFGWYRIKTEYGEQIVYEPEQFALAFADNSYQCQIKDLLETDKYDVFLDVGAAWGHFALIGAKLCKRVIAFEPQPFRYGFLLYNCRHLFNVDCRYEFVTCKGEAPTMGALEEMCESRHDKPYNVKTITLDDIEIKPNEKVLVKLDVEGSELKVLSGCPNLIANTNVDWIIDVHHHQGVTSKDVKDFFKNKNNVDLGTDHICSVLEFIGVKN